MKEILICAFIIIIIIVYWPCLAYSGMYMVSSVTKPQGQNTHLHWLTLGFSIIYAITPVIK